TKPSAGALAAGVDVRGDGSYLVAPGSVHISGGEYVVDDLDEAVKLERIAEAPPWLVDLVRADRPKRARVGRVAHGADKSTADPTASIAEGKRNEALTSLAGTMRRRGITEDAIAAALMVTNRQRCR